MIWGYPHFRKAPYPDMVIGCDRVNIWTKKDSQTGRLCQSPAPGITNEPVMFSLDMEANMWLVVSTPLKNISQLFAIYGNIENVPNHQPI